MDKAAQQESTVEAELAALAEKLGVPRTKYSVLTSFLLRQKLAALRELAYGLSHEINNPLANIAARAQTLLKDESDPARRKMLATINTQAFRAFEMIADLMLFAKPPALSLKRVDAFDLAAAVACELFAEAKEQGTALFCRGLLQPLEFEVDLVQLSVALRAVVRNSLEALRSGGRVDLSVGATEGSIFFRVTDNGPGLTDQARRHMFDPFYSGREAGRGLGLGLSKCWRVVELHGGRMEVASELGKGASVSLHIPVSG